MADLLEPYDYDRLVGFQIIHHDGLIETLGRWDPEDAESIDKIYDFEKEGPVEALEFRHGMNMGQQNFQ